MRVNQYFRKVIDEVFGEVLLHYGGVVEEAKTVSNVVRYSTSSWFVEFCYLVEESPNYCPHVGIGPLPELSPIERDRQVDIQCTVPVEASDLKNYFLNWRYADENEMRRSYENVRDIVFVQYAAKFLLDRDSLKALVVSCSDECNRKWRKQINDHNDSIYRTKASEAFREKRFTDFIVQMSLIPDERKTALEIKKVAFARKQLRK
ncbi:hypothetical protein [Stieleria varia]|nr:hypothetical protein [Stieleria varia]